MQRLAVARVERQRTFQRCNRLRRAARRQVRASKSRQRLGVERIEQQRRDELRVAGVLAPLLDVGQAERLVRQRVAGEILRKVESIKQVAQEFRNDQKGTLSIATTHTQARYALPPAIKVFMERYPEVSLHMHQGTPVQISEMAVDGTVELERVENALRVGRSVLGQERGVITLFRVIDAAGTAERTQVRIGRTSVSMMEVVGGLTEGDEIILSDMSAWDRVERVRLR